jgi:hypothetical protein
VKLVLSVYQGHQALMVDQVNLEREEKREK